MTFINRILVNQRFLLALFCIVALFASLQSYFAAPKSFEPGGALYTSYNNYVIFRQSFFHLIHQQDLYQLYLEEQADLFKYSPAFALFFAPLAMLPDIVGLSIWNLLNALTLFFAIRFLPKMDIRTKGLVLVFVVVELLTSVQNEQSNALIAGLIIFAFCFLEKEKYWLASLLLVMTVFIKLFGIVALALYLLYPNKWKLTYTTATWVVFFTLIPLVAVPYEQLIFLYKSWGNMLEGDHSISDGFSVIGWLRTWFHWDINKTLVSVTGAAIFCIPLLKIRSYSNYQFRILMLASVLIWVVIFNHRAESPTFIIAVSGVALWYYSLYPKKENYTLLVLAFVFCVLAPTDIFPKYVRQEWFKPYVVKAVPCILIWVKIIWDLLAGKLLPRPAGFIQK